MSAARRLPVITSILAAGLAITAGSIPSVRSSVARLTGLSAPGGTWRIVAIVLAILNLKNLPFVWHYRIFHALLYHLYIQPTELPPSALFLPLITSTHTPMAETDYNFHKSNSTYFTDLDVARFHLIMAITVKGIRGIGKHPENKNTGWNIMSTTRAAGVSRTPAQSAEAPNAASTKTRKPSPSFLKINAFASSGNTESGLNTPTLRASTPPPPSVLEPKPSRALTDAEWWDEATKPGTLLIAFGGTACVFHREIAPYTRFEIWTRVLSWDRKWLYVVSHFVEAGAFKAPRYILQPWKGVRAWVVRGEDSERLKGVSEEEKSKAWRRKVYASSVSKYVVKKGRLTIPPELVLARSEMLPPKPPGVKSTFETGYTPPKSESPEEGSPESGSTLDVLEESLFNGEEEGEWNWEKCERMRLKGLKLAQQFDALDGLREVFDGGEGGAMGVYTDLIGSI